MNRVTRVRAASAFVIAGVVIAIASLTALQSSAQSRGGEGLTGDPLVDSILQAPGPDFIEPRNRSRDNRQIWEDPGNSGAPVPRERGDEPSFAEDEMEPREIEPAPGRQVRRDPPPTPAQRGDGPLDIIIRDVEPEPEPEPDLAQSGDNQQSEIAAGELGADAPEPDEAGAFGEEADKPVAPPRVVEDEASQPATSSTRDVAAAPETRLPARRPADAPASSGSSQSGASLDRMIGQLLLLGFHGQAPTDDGVRRVSRQLADGAIGGVILMSRNIDSPRQVKSLTRTLTKAAEGQPAPFIGVDQEGGYVQRLSRVKGFKIHPSAERLGQRNDPQGAYSTYRDLALELREYGFNLNLGPVVDLNLNTANPVIGRLKRSYGSDADHVTAFAKAFVYAHNESGVLTAAKHFPGHGSSDTDSHDVLVDISKTWTEAELRPYRKLIEADAVDMIMIGHLYHPSFSDNTETPASLSAEAIKDVLRDSLNYDGVVITDDLDMRGVRQTTTFEERIVGAISAGNDILLIANSNGPSPDLPARVRSVIRAAIDDGRLSIERIRESYERVMALKEEMSRLQRTATSAGQDRGLDEHTSGG